MINRKLSICVEDVLSLVDISCQVSPARITFEFEGLKHSIEAENIFECFILLRAKLPHIKFLCKGAKVNVHPSRMSSQMSAGFMAYELVIGKQALRRDIVNIFDYDDKNLTNDPNAQHEFFKLWIASLQY